MITGALEIQLLGEVARLRTDMAEAKRIVGDAASTFEKHASTMRSVFQTLGLGISAGAFIAFAKSVIDSADSLGKMSQKVGIAVGDLSQLKYAAQLSDVSVESLGKGMKGLAQKITEANDPASKAGQIMKSLGVDINAGASPAIDKIANAFASLPDGTTKAALAVEVFGKAGMDMIPLLNQGAAGIRAMKDEAQRLGLTLTDETAKAAEAFNDNLTAVKSASTGAGIAIFNDLSPAMVRITKAMKEAAEESGMLKAVWIAMGGIASEALGLNATETESLTRNLRRAQAEVAKFGGELTALRRKELLDGVVMPGNMIEASFVRANFQARLTKETLDAIAGKYGDQVSRSQQQGRGAAGGVDSALEARIKGLLATSKAADAAAKSMKDLGLADAHVVAFLKMEAELHASVAKAIAEGEDARRKKIDSIEEEIRRQEFQNETLGMTREQIALLTVARLEEQMAILKASGAMETDLAQLQEEIDLRKKLADAIGRGEAGRAALDAQNAALRDQASIWGELSRTAGDFFADLITNGREAFGNLRDYAKRFLSEMIAIFAQRWVLQMGASLLGTTAAGSALAGMAGQVGQGSLAGSLLSAGGGLLQSGLGSLLGGGTGGAVAASELLSTLSAAGPYVAAIAAVYALYSAFKDKGENWKGKLGFGANARAYTTEGPFGVQGFEYLAGNDATNRAIQAFMGSTVGIDRQLAARMTPAQIAAISGRLTGAYSTRNDGQPAEFAFGKGDDTAAQQLTLEFLQKKYGTIFDEIDKTFAEFIRGYTGSSEDLLKAIGEFAGLLDMLDATGIKGLNIETLRAFQKEGEELGDTFARVTQQFATFQDLYYTDAEKIAMVQDQVAAVFADLGIAVPTSNEEFRKLVESLDLSTESGRKMFTALMGVAPAFNTITNAAAAAVTRFNTLAATLSPSFGASNARSVLEARVRAWMGLSPSNSEGWTVESTIDNIGRMIREGRIGDALTYAQSLGGNAVTILNDMLEAYIAWTTAMQNAQGPVTSVGTAVSGLGDAAARAAAQMQDAKNGLWAYLQGLLLNPQLSPLSPGEQLREATRQFYEQLRLARGGDLGAASGLQGYIDRVLTLGRDASGSGSAYIRLFREITSAAADFAKPGGAQDLQNDMYLEARTGNEILRDVRQILLDIRDRGTADGDKVADTVESAAVSTAMR